MNTKMLLIGVVLFGFAASASEGMVSSFTNSEVGPVMAKKTSTAGRIAIAIAKLENKSEMPDSMFGELRSRMQQCIAGTMKFHVQDREYLKSLMREQALAAAGIVGGEGAGALAAEKVELASYIVLGTVQSFDTVRSNGSVEGGQYAMSKFKIELLVKLVNCRTGSIVAVKTVIGQGVNKVTVADSPKSSVGQGMRDATDEACHAVADWLRDTLACPPKVLKVDNGEIIVDLNENEVKEGDVFDVEECDVIAGDDGDAVIGLDGKYIGSVGITRPGSQTSRAMPTENGNLSIEKINIRKHTYRLRRVSKDSWMKRLRRRYIDEHQGD